MAFNSILAHSHMAYARIGSDDVLAYIYNSDIYVKINTGAWAVLGAIPHPGTISASGGNSTRQANKLEIHENGLIVATVKVTDGVTRGVYLHIIHYTGTPPLVSLLIEPLADYVTLNYRLAGGSVWYSNTNLIHVVWSGHFRSMGSNFYTIKHQSYDASTGVASTVTHLLESAAVSETKWVLPSPNKDILTIVHTGGSAYMPVSTLVLGTTNPNGVNIQQAHKECVAVKDTGVDGQGVYTIRAIATGGGLDTTILVFDDDTIGTADPIVVINEVVETGKIPLAAGCSLNAAKDTLAIFVVIRNRFSPYDKIFRVYTLDVSVPIGTSGRTLALAVDQVITGDNLTANVYAAWSNGVFPQPNVDVGENVFINVQAGLNTEQHHQSRLLVVLAGAVNELTISVGTTGGRSLSALIHKGAEDSLLTISLVSIGGRSLNAQILGPEVFVSNPEDDSYSLVLDGTQVVPIIQFTARGSDNGDGTSSIVVDCEIPIIFLDSIYALNPTNAQIDKLFEGDASVLYNGVISEIGQYNDNVTLQFALTRININTTHTEDKVMYIRTIDGSKTTRIPPRTNINPGQVLNIGDLSITVRRYTLHISAQQQFMEVL